MRKIKRPKINEYVFVTKWKNSTFYDPGYVGFIDALLETETEILYQVKGSNKWWKHCYRITKEEGEKILKSYKLTESMFTYMRNEVIHKLIKKWNHK